LNAGSVTVQRWAEDRAALLWILSASVPGRNLGTDENAGAAGPAPAIQDRRPQKVSRTP